MNRRTVIARRLWAGRALRAGGALIVLGSVLPWVYLPFSGARVPVPGLLGWGALTLLLGLWLLRRPAWWSGLVTGGVCLLAGWKAFRGMPASIMAGVLAIEGRMQPLNDLLARFTLPPISVFDLGGSWADIRGPGPMTVLLGACLALVGGLATVSAFGTARRLDRCPACGHRHRPGRPAAYCVACGGPMPAERACPECHTLAEPDDAFCAVCGTGLPAGT